MSFYGFYNRNFTCKIFSKISRGFFSIMINNSRRFKMDVAAANEATKEKESQLQSQSALISQLQSLHADAQNLLKKQEEQHKVQMEGVKRSQKKLILFCQKLEMKRDEEG